MVTENLFLTFELCGLSCSFISCKLRSVDDVACSIRRKGWLIIHLSVCLNMHLVSSNFCKYHVLLLDLFLCVLVPMFRNFLN